MNPIARVVGRLLGWRHRRFVVAGNSFRERRMRMFVAHIRREEEFILDVGYGYGQFEDQLLELGVANRVLALDVVSRDASRHPNVVGFVVADVACLPFADRAIDLVYCNSLLEHVGDWPAQRRALLEIARVARKVFVQTPNRHFPIEPHHLVPFYQYWPRPAQRWVGERVLGHYEEVWLLDRRAVHALADACGGIAVWEEKVLGIVKSFVLYTEHSVQSMEQDGDRV